MMVYTTLHRFPQTSVGQVPSPYLLLVPVVPMGPEISAGAMFALSLRKIINKLIQLRSQCYHPLTFWKTYQRCRS